MDWWIIEGEAVKYQTIRPSIQKSIYPFRPSPAFRVSPTFFALTGAVLKKHEQQLRHPMEI
jgi:hypothetical protein